MRLSILISVLFCGAASGCATGNQLGSTGGGGSGGAGASTAATTGEAGQGGGNGGNGGNGGTAGSGAQTAGSGGQGGDAGQAGAPQGGGGTGGAGGSTMTGTGGAPDVCGDGVLGPTEQCDSTDLGNETCETQGFLGGALSCAPNCKLDTTQCNNCGNGMVEPLIGEECDFDSQGKPLVLTTCAGLEHPESPNNPGCDPTCHYDVSPCLCGNNSIDPGEACDGADLGGQTCADLGFQGGALTCNASCKLVATGCTNSKCGDGVIDPGEQCDGMALGGKTCVTEGFTAGSLSCGANCTVNTSGCTKCGNGVKETGEGCDDGNTMSGDGCSATCQMEVTTCDPDGTYMVIQGGPISYSCCLGLVSVNVSSFIFQSDGAAVLSSPSNPVPMTGAATTCPSGTFNNTGTISGGCTETYTLAGGFTGPNTWTGTYTLTFTGSQCGCFGGSLGTPCVNQVYAVTATR